MHRTLVLLAAAALIAAGTSCSTTGLARSWVAPDAPSGQFKKLGVVALTNQEVYRREAEWALVQELGDRGLASYTVLEGLQALHDTAKVVATLQQNGCDGIVTLQLKSAKVRPDTGTPPRAAASPAQVVDDYWVDPSAQEVQSFAPGQYFSVEVHVFDIAKRKMVYNGLAIEQDAKDTQDLVRMVRQQVMSDLRSKGVVSGK